MVTFNDDKKLVSKRSPKKRLTEKFAASKLKPGRYSDGYGLHLWVKPSGAKYWIQRLVIQGKSRDFSLGSIRFQILVRAREIAYQNFCVARLGGNPLHDRDRKHIPTFKEAAEEYHRTIRPKFTSDAAHKGWLASLKLHAYDALGNMKIDQIALHDVRSILEPIWETNNVHAKRIKQRISNIFSWAIALQYRNDNPTLEIEKTLAHVKPETKHFSSLPYQEIYGFLRDVEKSSPNVLAKLGLEFLILTAARSTEVRKARWKDIDLVNRVWTIPPADMKMRRLHRVPLSSRVVAILKEAATLRGKHEYVFHGERKPLAELMIFRKLIKPVNDQITIHGFRTTFRTWVQERTNCEWHVAEMALAHEVKNSTERAYARSDFFDKRIWLMEKWAEYVTQPYIEGKVIPLMQPSS